jgi:signal transduction histidine kinase/ligand-binding sensor domain-containing protein
MRDTFKSMKSFNQCQSLPELPLRQAGVIQTIILYLPMAKSHPPVKQVALLVIILLFLSNSTLHAQAKVQTIEPTYISVSDGLVSPTVNAVIQDSYGLMWIGTTNGLQKYDGYKFQTFKNIPGNTTSLQHNNVWSLFEDTDHDIWIGNSKGVSKYIRQKNEFKNYNFAPAFNFTLESEVAGFRFFKDSKNRLWANTLSAQLVQYDSVKDEWRRAKYDVPNMSEVDQITSSHDLVEDLKGNLWLGSFTNGLMRQGKDENSFKPVPAEQLGGFDFKITENNITALYADKTNTLWITTRNGVYKYNPETASIKTLKKYSDSPLDAWNQWNQIWPDQQGNIWIANNFRGLLKFDGISDNYTEIEIVGKVIMRTHGWNITFTQFMIDQSGIFWFGSREAGLVKYDPVNKPFQFLGHDANNPNSMSAGGTFGILASKVKPGITYVGTRGGGVNIYDPKKQTFEKVTFKVVDDMFGGSARAIAEDTDGSLWLGTWGDGLIELDRNYKEVRRFKYDSTNATSISDNQVRVIKPDNKDQLWIGTNSGLNILNTKTNTLQRVVSQQTRQYPDRLVAELEKLISTDQKIGAIEKVTDNQDLALPIEINKVGTYWVMSVGEVDAASGLADFGWLENEAKDTVWLMSTFANTFHAGGASKNRIEIKSITLQPGKYTIHYKTDDSHAFGKWNEPAPTQTSLYGIALLKLKDENQLQSFQTPVVPEHEELVIDGISINDIEVTDKFIWVAAVGSGLNRIDPVTNSVKNYKYNAQDNNSLSHNNVLDIQQDSHGMIWLATPEGVNKFDPIKEIFTRYTEADGLPTNLTVGVVEGDDGEMWIASQNGLSQMVRNKNLNKVTFINYNSSDGLGTDVFLQLTTTRAPDGRFYFGSEAGLTTFTNITSNKTPPAIIISNLFIANKSVLDMKENSPLTESLLDAKSISLPFDQNNLSFEFAALHYANPQKNQYAHMLKGYDQDWIYDNRNFAAYTNLDPGNYEFIVRAANAYGIWNETGKSIAIIIHPPWWRTWWAYASYVVLFVVFAYTTDRGVRRSIKLRERERSRERELKQAKEIEKAYTELKATQSQLIQSEKMASLGELTAGIAHEIQNPLNFVNNFSEVNKELIGEMNAEIDAGNFEEAKALGKNISDNEDKIVFHGKRADGIVKSMLQHSRTSSGKKEPTNINALADEYLRLAYHGLRAKDKSFNASMKTDFDESVGSINVIGQDLGRVILNLITNAFYAVTERKQQQGEGYEPTVTVSTKRMDKKIEIRVSDNGNGIPQNIVDKIFQPFFTTKPTGQGTGLGLSMSYDIISNAHGGELKVETMPSEGTTFIIILTD